MNRGFYPKILRTTNYSDAVVTAYEFTHKLQLQEHVVLAILQPSIIAAGVGVTPPTYRRFVLISGTDTAPTKLFGSESVDVCHVPTRNMAAQHGHTLCTLHLYYRLGRGYRL
jgi:hypothetical protein